MYFPFDDDWIERERQIEKAFAEAEEAFTNGSFGGMDMYSFFDDEGPDDAMIERMIKENLKKKEKKTFYSRSGFGANAPAFRDDLDVTKMVQMHMENMSIRKIAKSMGCSPNTVRSRLIAMGENTKHKNKRR